MIRWWVHKVRRRFAWIRIRPSNESYLTLTSSFRQHATEEYPPFRLAPNGVTVVCLGAPPNATGVVNGVTYTKRAREALLALVQSESWGELETSCTTDNVDFSELFKDAAGFNADISSWDVANVRTMEGMFRGATSFDQDISSWNVRAVTTMKYMFRDTPFNQPIGVWNTSNVEDMSWMIYNAANFNMPIGAWDTSRVKDFSGMFYGATGFNQPIGGWNTGSATTLYAMFGGATAFNQPIGDWDVSKVTNMADMFWNAAVFDQDISAWDTGSVTTMVDMFRDAFAFNKPLDAWNMSGVTKAYSMFMAAPLFNQPLGSWDMSKNTRFDNMFKGATNFNQDIGDWNTAAATDMSYMFYEAREFNQDVSDWNTAAVTTMASMFAGATAFNNGGQALAWTNTAAVTDMSYMFYNASAFNQAIPTVGNQWNTGAVTSMTRMFELASAFDQDLSSWPVADVDDCENFAGDTAAWGNPASSPPLPAFTNCDPTPTVAGAPPSSTPSTPSSSSSSSSSASTTGIIVGVVCGVVAAALLAAGLWWWVRRRRREASRRWMDPSAASSEPKEALSSVRDLPWHVSIHQRLDTSREAAVAAQQVHRPDDTAPFSPFAAMAAAGAAAGAAAAAVAATLRTRTRTTAKTKATAATAGTSAADSGDIEQGGTFDDSPPSKVPVEPRQTRSSAPVGYTGVVSLQGETHGSILHAKSPSMPHLSLEQTSPSAEVLERPVAERASSLSRSRSWDGFMDPVHDSIIAAEAIRRRRSVQAEKPLESSMMELPAIGDDFVPSIDMHVPVKSIEKTLTKVIGVGGYGKVYKGKYRGEEVAVKKLPPSNDDDEEQGASQSAYSALIKEIKLMSKFDSDRLVKVLGACTDDRDKCCLIMELMRGGDLSKKIHDPRRRRLSYIHILQITQDIAEGLAYLHPLVAHRDLKPGNILLDETGRAKIGDFGISKIKQVDKTFLSDTVAFNGTIMYMAPEQLNGGKLDEKVDVYSLGCIINEMWTRQYPWPNDEPRLMFQILRMVSMESKRPWMDPDTPGQLKRLITKCWAQVGIDLDRRARTRPDSLTRATRFARSSGPARTPELRRGRQDHRDSHSGGAQASRGPRRRVQLRRCEQRLRAVELGRAVERGHRRGPVAEPGLESVERY